MNNDKLIIFIEDIIVEHTQDQPAALLFDSLGCQHNDRATQPNDVTNTALYRIPPNTTAL